MQNENTDMAVIERFEKMLADNALYFFDVEEFEMIAEHFFNVGQYNKAVNTLEMARLQHPLAPTFPLKHAQFLVTLDKLEEAAKELDFAEGLDPYNVELTIARATILSKKGFHGKAVKLLKEALNTTQDTADIYSLLASEYQSMGNFGEAIKYLKRVLLEFPDDDVAMYNVALCYDALNEPESSIDYFKQFIDGNPYNELAWYHLGITYGKLKKYEKAIESLEYSLLVDEHFTAAYYEIARMYERQEAFEKAVETYQRSFEYDEPTGYIYYKLGHCYLQMNKNKQAMRYLKRAVREDVELDEAYLEMAAIEVVDGKIQEALYNLNKALELDPENPDYLFTAIEIYDKADMKLDMIKAYKKIIALDYDDDELYMDYAEVLIELDEVDDALALLQEGLEKHPESDDIHLMMAGYLMAINEFAKAFEHIKKANALDNEAIEKFIEYFPELLEDETTNRVIKQIQASL